MIPDKDYFTLAIVSALVAHNIAAVEMMLTVLASSDAHWAGEITEAIRRGNAARDVA